MAGKAPREPRSIVHVALLRGVNVGGRNSLPMRSLAGMFADAGCEGVRTYIQSGNVVFAAPPSVAKGIPDHIASEVAEQFGFRPTVIVRTHKEIALVAASHPFMAENADGAAVHVGFLDKAPTARQIAAIDPDRSPGDRLVVRGREVYLHLPNGVARSKLTNAYIDAVLATTSTVRNWRTVLKLAEMTRQAS